MCFCPCRTKIFGLVAFSTQTFFFSPRLHFSRLTPHGNLVQLGKTRAKVYSWKQFKNRWTSLTSTQEAQRRQTGRWDRFGRTASTAGGGAPHPPTSKSTVVALQGFSCIRTITGFQFSPAKIRVNLFSDSTARIYLAKIFDFCSICSFQADRWFDRTEEWCLHYTQFESAQFPDHLTTLTGIFQSSDFEQKGTWKVLSCAIMLEELKLGWGLKFCELTCFTKSNLEMPDGELDWALVCFEGEQFAAAHRFSIESQVQGMSYRVTQCRTDTFGDRFRICLLGVFLPFFFFITFFSLLGSFTYTQVLIQEKERHYSYRVWSEKWSKLPSF